MSIERFAHREQTNGRRITIASKGRIGNALSDSLQVRGDWRHTSVGI
jgi:hypothetical protein